MKLSARNQIAGTIKTVKPGAATIVDDALILLRQRSVGCADHASDRSDSKPMVQGMPYQLESSLPRRSSWQSCVFDLDYSNQLQNIAAGK